MWGPALGRGVAATIFLAATGLGAGAPPALGTSALASAGAPKVIHLTGVAEGPTGESKYSHCTFPTELALDEGDRPVGAIHLRACIAVGPVLRYSGWTKLTVGNMRGKGYLFIRFFSNSKGQLPYAQGHIAKAPAEHGSRQTGRKEGIEIKRYSPEAAIPTHSGAKVEVLLRPSGPFPTTAQN